MNGTVIHSATLNIILLDLARPNIDISDLVSHTLIAAQTIQHQATDLLNNYIICGQDPARSLLAKITAESRDGF